MKRYNIAAEVNTVAEDHGLITGRIRIKEATNGEWVRYEDAQSANRWAELDIAELIDDFGVWPLYWNGVWQACLNLTNVPVEHFKSEEECVAWCDEKNEDTIGTPTMVIRELQEDAQKLLEALEGLHFHHKKFEPLCRTCQASVPQDIQQEDCAHQFTHKIGMQPRYCVDCDEEISTHDQSRPNRS